MNRARLFKDGTIVDAYDVYEGRVSRNSDFVDIEEDFRAIYWGGAKHKKGEPGRPHFKIYLTREEYKKLTPEQKTRLEILRTQKHYQESEWHREWEDRFEEFAEIEKTITNPETKKRKRADAYIEDQKLAIEFQHSFINYDFEDRNSFYSELGINTIWIYDLTAQNVKYEDDTYSILENNAKGFFRIAEDPNNLKNNVVFIQSKDGNLYRVDALRRKLIDDNKQSTIREFDPVQIITPEELIDEIRNNRFQAFEDVQETALVENVDINPIVPVFAPTAIYAAKNDEIKTVNELWDQRYYFMILFNEHTRQYIRIVKDPQKNGQMERYGKWNHILYQLVDWNPHTNQYTVKSSGKIHMSWEDERSRSWKLIRGFVDWYK